MNQQANPLDQLRDIHQPAAIEGLQLAPGWWLLIALALIACWLLIARWRKQKAKLYLLKPARQELQAIAGLTPDNHAVAQLSALLKRVCLIYFPRRQVAALSGDQWIDFLNQQMPESPLQDSMQATLRDAAYRPDFKLASDQWRALVSQSGLLLEQLIRQAAREKKHD